MSVSRDGARWCARGRAFERKRTAVAWETIGEHAADFYKGTDTIKDACRVFAKDEGVAWLVLCLKNAGARGEPLWWPALVDEVSAKSAL